MIVDEVFACVSRLAFEQPKAEEFPGSELTESAPVVFFEKNVCEAVLDLGKSGRDRNSNSRISG